MRGGGGLHTTVEIQTERGVGEREYKSEKRATDVKKLCNNRKHASNIENGESGYREGGIVNISSIGKKQKEQKKDGSGRKEEGQRNEKQ